MKNIKGLNCILLIDDDEATNFINLITIRKLGIDVHTKIALSSQEAIEYLSSTGKYANATSFLQPNIIFLDINMPGMDGWDFLENYAKFINPQTIIIMLTTSSNPDDREKAKLYPEIKAFLNKPLTKEKMENIIKEYFSE